MEGREEEKIGVGDEGRTDTWLKKHTVMYTAATKHPMILSIRDGTVDLDAFKRWLGQDYLFVRAFVPFLSSVLIKAWKESDDPSEMEVLLSGIAALNDEIAWFKREASKWGVELTAIVPQNENLYLGQDYLFVRAFVPFLSSVLIKAWKESDDPSEMEVLLSGIAALNDEIAWFKREASKWGVELTAIVPQNVNQDYCRFLESLMGPDVEYTVAITALWVIELVYQQSFAHCLEDGNETPAELMETCQRWGNEDFGKYCSLLEKIANRRLRKATDEESKKAEVTFLRVLEHEVEFWNMSRG